MVKEQNMVVAQNIQLSQQNMPTYLKLIWIMNEHRYLNVIHSNIFITVLFFVLACGVAHQALEAIEPAGEDILILGCGPVGLLAVGIAKALGAVKVYANYSFLKLSKFWPFVIYFVLHITLPHCQFKVDFF